jgi:tripartite-type tricarboxylate transporter receptor subunit TctC
VTTDFILMAPGGTPDNIVSLLQREIKHVLQSKELQNSFRKQDIWVVGSTSEEAAASIKAGYDLWANVIKRAGMTPH